MRIRNARVSDIKELISLWRQMHTSHYAYDREYYRLRSEKKAYEATRRHYQDLIRNKKTIFLVAVEKDKVIGSLNAMIAERPPVFTKQIIIMVMNAVVDEKHRDRGVFSKLQNHLEQVAKKKKAKYIMLMADMKNPAVDIYRKMGYTEKQFQMVKKFRNP